MTVLGGRAEWVAVTTGAAVGLAGLALVSVVVRLADAATDDAPVALVVSLLVVALASLAAAGWVAASRALRAPLVHAATAAVSAMVIAEVVVVVQRAVIDETIPWDTAGLWLLLAVAAGLTGGRRALRPRRRADSGGV